MKAFALLLTIALGAPYPAGAGPKERACYARNKALREAANFRYDYYRFEGPAASHFLGPELELANAAVCGELDTIRMLIHERGVDPNAISLRGMPMLLWPMYHYSLEGYEALLDNGADPTIFTQRGGHDYYAVIHDIVAGAGVAFISLALDRGADPNAVSITGEHLIHTASRMHKWDVVELLVSRYGVDVDTFERGFYGNTVLDQAVGFGNFRQAYRLLTRYGADPSYELRDSPRPELIGMKPILNEIFYRPSHSPQAEFWQRKCQEYVLSQGIPQPPPSPRYADRRNDG